MNGYKLLFRGSWLLYFLIFISGCGVAAMGAYYYQDEGHLIPAVQIEMYKNMPEDSPTLKSLREQAAKVPEGMLAAALKCAGKLGDQPNLATPPNAKEGNLDKKNNTEKKEGNLDKKNNTEKKEGNLDKKNNTEKKECYWKPPFIGSATEVSNPFTAQQDSMTASLRSALINLGKSQVIMAQALGLDEQVILAKNLAKSLEEGDLGTSSEIDKALEISGTVQDAIDKETAKGKKLDVESKKIFITSIPFYIKGVISSIQTGKEAASIGSSLFNLDPMALLQVGALFSIVKNLPDLVSQLAGSTGKVMDFMTVNEIDKSEMKDQLADVF